MAHYDFPERPLAQADGRKAADDRRGLPCMMAPANHEDYSAMAKWAEEAAAESRDRVVRHCWQVIADEYRALAGLSKLQRPAHKNSS